jgi:Protein of unknown function (DUF559)
VDNQVHPRGQRLADLAAAQHGVVATWQLSMVGYSKAEIFGLAERGSLHRCHRGVYAVGHRRLSVSGRRMAGVLTCGPHALLSHKTAIAHWELRPATDGPIDITVPGRGRRGPPGIRVHNVRTLDPRDRTRCDGIPITTVHRTLLDYAEVAHRQQLRLAIDEAERRELFNLNALNELIDRSPGRRGIKQLSQVLADIRGPAPWTRSELERRFLALIREAGIPEPQVNVIVAGEWVDMYWPGDRPLVVELDGYDFHKSRKQFESDRRRDTILQLAGCRIVRVTQRRIEEDPRGLISDLLSLLPVALAASGR